MQFADWVRAGMKLLGIYFAVVGFAGLWKGILVLAAAGRGSDNVAAVALLSPLLEIAAGIFLTCRTELCLRWSGVRAAEPPPASVPPEVSH